MKHRIFNTDRVTALVVSVVVVVSVISSIGFVTAAGETGVELAPSKTTVEVDGSTTFDIVVTNANGGVGSYGVNVSLDNPAVADITAASDQAGSSSVNVVWGEANESVVVNGFLSDTADTGQVTIATVTVNGTADGETNVNVSIAQNGLGDEGATEYTVTSLGNATLTVGEGPTNAPTASFDVTPSEPQVGETVSLDASGSSDTDGSINSYAWDTDGDGNYNDATGETNTTTFDSTGEKTIGLEVTDDDGATDTTTKTITVVEAPSPANYSVAIDSTNSPTTETETLDVTATVENVGESSGSQTIALSVDGTERDSTEVSLGAGEKTSVTLSWATATGDAGSYTATVSSANDSDSKSVTVDEPDPANFSVAIDSTNSPINETESLDVSATIENIGESSGTQTVTLAVDGTDRDSTEISLDAGESTSVTLSWDTSNGDAGSYTATVSSANDSDSQSVTVNEPPTASFSVTPAEPSDNETVMFNASNSTDSDGEIVAYHWDLNGNGTFTETGETVNTTYDNAGNVTVELMVQDDNGATDTATKEITVHDDAITVSPGQPGFGVAIAVLALLTAALLTRRRD